MPSLVISKPPTMRFPAVNPSHPAGIRALVDQLVSTADRAFPEPLSAARGKTVLLLGSTSLGYGASAAVALARAGFERIIGIGFAQPPVFKDDKVRRAAPDWYVTASLHECLDGKITTYLADAFADETRERVIGDMVASGTKVDLVLYSLAAAGRSYLGHKWMSSINVVGEPLDIQNLSVNLKTGERALKAATLASASEEQSENTRRVMGGEDICLWVSQMLYHDVLEEGATLACLSYIGPEFGPLRRVYWDGTLGAAKKDIDLTMGYLDRVLDRKLSGKALSVMAPAVVTRASAVIPGVMTYVNLYLGADALGKGRYLDPIDVAIDLARALYGDGDAWKQQLDSDGRLRLDGAELEESLQSVLQDGWKQAAKGEVGELLDRGADVYMEKYFQQYGWSVPGVDYEQAVEFDVKLGEAQRVFDLLNSPEEPVPVTGTARVDAYFQAMFDADTGVVARAGGLEVTTTTDAAQSALLADVTGNHRPHEAGVMAPSMDFAESIGLVFGDIETELKEETNKSVIHAQEVIYILAETPLAGPRKRRLKRRAVRHGLYMTNRTATDESGTILTAGDTSLAIGVDLSQEAPVKTPDPDTLGELVGTEPVISRSVDLFVQATGDDNIVHTSRLAAQELGLPYRVAHGMLVFALADKWLHHAFPDLNPARARKITAKFSGLVLPEDTLLFYVDHTDRGHKIRVLKDRGDEPAALVVDITSSDLDAEQIQKIRDQKTKQTAEE